jgi:hypothetical protein
MISIAYNKTTGLVTRINYKPTRLLPNEIAVENLPDIPKHNTNTQTPVLMYKFGKLYYAIQNNSVVEEPESAIPEQEEVEYKPSNEELRRAAYEAEADPFARAYTGYILEGNIVKAEEAKKLYLKTKNSIRKQYP